MQQAVASALTADRTEWNGLFSRVGQELRTLADAVAGLQGFLTPLVADIVVRDPEALVRLQDLDLLEQSLNGLSELMSCLDTSFTPTDLDTISNGMQAIRLADLARRLSSADHQASAAPTGSADLDLFL